MVRLADLPPATAKSLRALELPVLGKTPLHAGPPLARRRVAIVSTAGLGLRGDRPFAPGDGDFRVLPADAGPDEVVMSHTSVSYDRTGFQQDLNVAYPLERLQAMAAEGEIGSVAALHLSVMGATDPARMEPHVAEIVRLLRADQVDAALLVPV